MAGACTRRGVRVSADNRFEAAVDRIEAWPYSQSVNTKSGTRVDPDTDELWSPPDLVIRRAEAALGPNKSIVPTSDSTINLIDLSLEMVASKDHPAVLFGFCLVGGYQGYRLGDGNFWAVYRTITTYDNGSPTTFSGPEPVGGAENNSGGTMGFGGVVEGMLGWVIKPGGLKLKVLAHYELRPLSFTSQATNGFTWRPPRLQLLQWGLPSSAEAAKVKALIADGFTLSQAQEFVYGDLNDAT